MAFEQGRTLPTPEVIPFRLTRDLVHGMGVSGVVGVFQRCSEETLSVMRKSQEELKTIVEVMHYVQNKNKVIRYCCMILCTHGL